MESGSRTGLRRGYALEVFGSNLKVSSLLLVPNADSDDLAFLNAKWAAVFDHDAAPLATSKAENHLITHPKSVRSDCRGARHRHRRYHQGRASPSASQWSAATVSREPASTLSALRQRLQVPSLIFTGFNAPLASFASMS